MATTVRPQIDEDFEEHVRTYKWFVKGAAIFAAHALLILGFLAWYFAE